MRCDPALIRLIDQINEEQLDRFYERLTDELWVMNGKTIAVWGLSYKPGTDELWGSTAMKLIEHLQGTGASIRVHDPVALEGAKGLLHDVKFASDAIEAVQDADALVVCTEWREYAEIDLKEVFQRMQVPIIFDGRNCIDRRRAQELGFTVIGVGKAPIRAS